MLVVFTFHGGGGTRGKNSSCRLGLLVGGGDGGSDEVLCLNSVVPMELFRTVMCLLFPGHTDSSFV